MSDTPEDQPKAKPRISFIGIESLTKEHDAYESQGIATAERYDGTLSCGKWGARWWIHGLDGTIHKMEFPNKTPTHTCLNDLLEAKDLYLVHVQSGDFSIRSPLKGELYARKVVSDRINVTDIQIGEAKP